MPSCIRRISRIATAALCSCPLCLDYSRFCKNCLLTAHIKDLSSSPILRRSSPISKQKLLNVRIKPKGLWSSRNVGLLSAQSPGSTVAVASPKILRTSTAMHWPSSDLRPSDSCCESYVILDKPLGQTLSTTVLRVAETRIAGQEQFRSREVVQEMMSNRRRPCALTSLP
jgi:hypothetical protein